MTKKRSFFFDFLLPFLVFLSVWITGSDFIMPKLSSYRHAMPQAGYILLLLSLLPGISAAIVLKILLQKRSWILLKFFFVHGFFLFVSIAIASFVE